MRKALLKSGLNGDNFQNLG